jgi:hypothetical protein
VAFAVKAPLLHHARGFYRFRLTRRGRIIELENRLSPTERAEWLARMRQAREDARTAVPAKAQEIEKLSQQYDSFDIIANIAFAELYADPETYKEWSHKGLQQRAEYIALLLLKHPFNSSDNRLLGDRELRTIRQQLDAALGLTTAYYMGELAAIGDDEPDALSRFRFKTVLRGILERNPGYQRHLVSILLDLFSHPSVARWMKESLGYSIQDAIKLNDVTAQLGYQRLTAKHSRSKRAASAARNDVQLFRRGRQISDEAAIPLVERLAKLTEPELAEALDRMAIAASFESLGDTMSFTTEEVSQISGLEPAICAAYLQGRSLDFGCVPADFSMPTATPLLAERPFIHHDGRYLVPAPGWLG